jgi:glycosyltransferase involved in cell wall biosynthesis
LVQPILTIIIPIFNGGNTLSKCLESIVNQKFDGFQVYIVDGQSEDDTLSIIESYRGRYSFIRFISEQDYGIYDAMNKGIANSETEWFFFLGSDDELFDDQVLSRIFSTQVDEDAMVIYGRVLVLPDHFVTDIPVTFSSLTTANICHQGIFYSRRVFSHFRYDTKFRVLADWDLNLKIFARFPNRTRAIDLIVSRFSNSGISAAWRVSDEYRNHFAVAWKLYWRYLPLSRFKTEMGARIFAKIERIGRKILCFVY